MSGRSGGFSVTISAVDRASAPIEAINKRLAKLSAPAERFNKALTKFGDTSGISRVSEGVATLGKISADTFRSLDRLQSPLAAITGAATIGGMIELTRRWAEFGNQVGNTAYRMNLPVEKLGALRGAARLAGVSASSLDESLLGLGKTLSGAAYGRDPHAIQLLTTLGVRFGDATHGARQAEDALGDVAEAIKKLPDARTQERVLGELGMSPDLLPMLKNGRKGLEEYRKKAEATGSSMTAQMVENARKMNEAWQRLGLDFEGVGNRIIDSWAGTVTKILENSSKWIEANKKTADSIAEISTAIGVIVALKPAAWVLRLLGLMGPAELVGAGAAIGLGASAMPPVKPGQYSYGLSAIPGMPGYQAPSTDDYKGDSPSLFSWLWAKLLGGKSGGGGGAYKPRTITVPTGPTKAAAVMEETRAFWKSKGFTDAQVAGILAAGPAAESGFRPDAVGDGGTSYGLYQHHGVRMTALMERNGPAPTVLQQNEFAWDELNQPQNANLLRSLRVAKTSGDAARIWTKGFEQPANADAEAETRAAGAPQFEQQQNGHVQVEVNLKNAPPGTTAKVTSSGAVKASPPRVETSLPMVH